MCCPLQSVAFFHSLILTGHYGVTCGMQMLERDGLTCPTYRNCLEYPPASVPTPHPERLRILKI